VDQGETGEIAMFQLNDGVDREAFLRAAEATTGWLRNRPGYLGRDLLEEDGGQWVDLVRWSTIDQARSTAEAMLRATETGPFVAAIDPATVRMLHPRLVARYRQP
jgi:hypothetical protein